MLCQISNQRWPIPNSKTNNLVANMRPNKNTFIFDLEKLELGSPCCCAESSEPNFPESSHWTTWAHQKYSLSHRFVEPMTNRRSVPTHRLVPTRRSVPTRPIGAYPSVGAYPLLVPTRPPVPTSPAVPTRRPVPTFRCLPACRCLPARRCLP